MEFKKYMHVERFGTDEVQGVELGKCYIFPKLDGTNSSTWFNNGIQAGSRTRQLSSESDNAGFYKFATTCPNIINFHKEFPNLRLYGE